MALEEYVGPIILTINSQEFEVTKLSTQINTGRKMVKTMNSAGTVKGFSSGIKSFTLGISVVIPLNGDIDWTTVVGAKITVQPLMPGGQTVTYQNCAVTDFSESYDVENEATRDINLFAGNRVFE